MTQFLQVELAKTHLFGQEVVLEAIKGKINKVEKLKNNRNYRKGKCCQCYHSEVTKAPVPSGHY